MKRLALLLAFAAGLAPAAIAEPINPRIDSHDFNFGAWEPADTPFYDPSGVQADVLSLRAFDLDREVTAFW
jgi:hypothetical protein